jgi:hypothetical protein
LLVGRLRLVSLRRALSIGALGLVVLAAAIPSPVLAWAPAEHEALAAEGQRLVDEERHAEAAEKLASAYLVMPPELRVGEQGRAAVTAASNAYEGAWQATGDAGQLEANQVLLQAYFADLETARAAGQSTTPADEHEQALRERSTAIEQMLIKVGEAAPAEPVAEKVPAPAPVLDPESIEPQQEITFPPPDPRLRRNALLLMGFGAAGTVVGGIMVIAGAVGAARAEDQRQSMPADEPETRAAASSPGRSSRPPARSCSAAR